MHRLISALIGAALSLGLLGSLPAHAQGCGSGNPNCIVPTAPFGTSTGQAASTKFVQQALAGTPASSVTVGITTINGGTANCVVYDLAGVLACLGMANGAVLNTSAGGVPAMTATPTLGVAGTAMGSLGFAGSVSGIARVQPQPAAGTPTILWPNTSGTLVDNAAAPLVIDAATGTISCSGCGAVATVAALKALAVPVDGTSIYVQGYFAANDGGEGDFVFSASSSASDNGGTVLIPNSAPPTGRWLRAHVGTNGGAFSTKWFGAKGDGVTNDNTPVGNALAAAIAAKGVLYFPATSACYIANVTVPDGTQGLGIVGDSPGNALALGNIGSVLCPGSAGAAIDMTASSGGNIGNIRVEYIKIYNGAGDGIKVTNAGWITIRNNEVTSSAGTSVNIIGTGPFSIYDNSIYAGSGNALKISASATTNSGPGDIVGGQISNQGGSATGCVVITGGPLGLVFSGIFFGCQGASMAATVTIDGDGTSPTQAGSVTFIGCHGESDYNTANTGADFLIGATNKFGSVSIIGYSGFGQGSGTNYQRDGVRVVAAQNVSVKDSDFTKLSSTNGYSRGAIRIETSFPAAGDIYRFSNNRADISGTMYSDANGRIPTTFVGDASYDQVLPNNIFGETNNSDACTGCVGEHIKVTGTLTNVGTSGIAQTGVSLPLSIGDWRLSYQAYFNPSNASTNIAAMTASISTTTSHDFTLGNYSQLYHGSGGGGIVPGLNNAVSITGNEIREKVATPTTYNCIVSAVFSVSTLQATCVIEAWRTR